MRKEWKVLEIIAREGQFGEVEGRKLFEYGKQLKTLREDGLIKRRDTEFGFKMSFYSLTHKGSRLLAEAGV